MRFYITLGFFSFLLFLADATAFPGLGRRLFGRAKNNDENGPPIISDAGVPPTDDRQYDNDDANLMEREEKGEPSATANQALMENQIPPTILRKIKEKYGDIDPQVLAELARDPQAASQIESTTDLEGRGKFKKLTGIAFILALLKIIF